MRCRCTEEWLKESDRQKLKGSVINSKNALVAPVDRALGLELKDVKMCNRPREMNFTSSAIKKTKCRYEWTQPSSNNTRRKRADSESDARAMQMGISTRKSRDDEQNERAIEWEEMGFNGIDRSRGDGLSCAPI